MNSAQVGRELGTWVARCARAGSNGMFWLSLVQIALTLALTLNTTRGAALGRKPPPRPVARPSGVDLGEPRWERVHMFSSVIIGVDHVCLYGLIALYGPTLPRLRLVMAQWVVGLSTLPATWAVWGRVSDDLQYAFAFYFALLRVLYYATLAVLAREVRRGDVVPKGLASWPRTLAFLRRRADDIWPPATILLLFVYCMYVYDTGE